VSIIVGVNWSLDTQWMRNADQWIVSYISVLCQFQHVDIRDFRSTMSRNDKFFRLYNCIRHPSNFGRRMDEKTALRKTERFVYINFIRFLLVFKGRGSNLKILQLLSLSLSLSPWAKFVMIYYFIVFLVAKYDRSIATVGIFCKS